MQSLGDDKGEIIVKAGFEFDPTRWQLKLLDAQARMLSLVPAPSQRLDLFAVFPYRIEGLKEGQSYRLLLTTRNAGGDSVFVERIYTHRPQTVRWQRLTHAPLVGGDFAGSPLSAENVPGRFEGTLLSVWQYGSDQRWQAFDYNIVTNSWAMATPPTLSPRHGAVRFVLQAADGVFYTFSGLGFVTLEREPGQRLYLKNMISGPYPVIPFHGGPDGEVRSILTRERAYLLTEGGPSQVWVRKGDWGQYRAPDLPEPTGTLATFRLGDTAYVVNQRPGRPARLWAFDTQREGWSRRADLPGPPRRRGVSFVAGGRAFFGLGLDPDEKSLRDLWQYDPTADRWQYAGEYPGAGTTYLTVGQLRGRTFLGWGYEHQPTPAGGVRLIGCTDFWEIKP